MEKLSKLELQTIHGGPESDQDVGAAGQTII